MRAGINASRLTGLFGVEVSPEDFVALAPASVEPQWYIDNLRLTTGNEALWWALSRPDRLVLTRREIRSICTDLQGRITEVKKRLILLRKAMVQQRSRSMLLNETPALVDELTTCEMTLKLLRKMDADLPALHERLTYKYRRPPLRKD